MAVDDSQLLLAPHKDSSAATRKGEWGGVGGPGLANMVKGKGKKRGLDLGNFTFHKASSNLPNKSPDVITTSQPYSREAPTREDYGRVAGGQGSAGPDLGGNGAKSSTGSSRLTRHAPPWWFGSGPNAATWLPTTVTSMRMVGGHRAGDPLKS